MDAQPMIAEAPTAVAPPHPPRHIMLDLETMGTKPGSAIVSIGAVEFDPYGSHLGQRFYVNIKLASCMSAGLRVDGHTIDWWMRQSEEARAALYDGERLDLGDALAAFAAWCRNTEGDRRIWGHGASFDPVLLEWAFRAARQSTPWRYSATRDTRTLYDIAGIDVAPYREAGVHHNALCDAVAQAKAVQAAYAKLGLARPALPEAA